MVTGKAGVFSTELTTRALETFLTVCETGTMSAAAGALGISQAAVSQQTARIERILDVRLFERTGAALVLTPAGLQLRYHAIRILEAAHQAEVAMLRYQGVLVPRISIGLMETMADVLELPIIETLKPLAEQITIAALPQPKFEDGLLDGRHDIVVLAQEGMVEGMRWFELVTEPGVLLAPKGFFRGDVEIEALAERLPMVRFSSQRRLARLIDTYLRRITLGVPRRFEFDRVSMIAHTVAAGDAWAITTPYGLLQAGDSLDRIDVHPLPPPGLSRTIVLGARGPELLNIPDKLAQQCRLALRRTRDTRISRFAPRAVQDIRIPGS